MPKPSTLNSHAQHFLHGERHQLSLLYRAALAGLEWPENQHHPLFIPSFIHSFNNYYILHSKTREGGREDARQETGVDLLSKTFEIFPENISLSYLGGVYLRKVKTKTSPLTILYTKHLPETMTQHEGATELTHACPTLSHFTDREAETQQPSDALVIEKTQVHFQMTFCILPINGFSKYLSYYGVRVGSGSLVFS